MLEHKELMQILPQRYPFIFIDRVEEIEKGKRLVAIKNITANEWPFTSPTYKSTTFPETLLIEAAAQAALVLYYKTMIDDPSKHPHYILGKVTSEFLNPVVIGEQIRIIAYATKMITTGGVCDVTIKDSVKELAQIKLIFSVND